MSDSVSDRVLRLEMAQKQFLDAFSAHLTEDMHMREQQDEIFSMIKMIKAFVLGIAFVVVAQNVGLVTLLKAVFKAAL